MQRIPAFLLAGFLISSLAACGLTGDLQRPDPLFGRTGSDVAPATLPDEGSGDLPPLPPRPSSAQDDEDDGELLGGPGGFF